jgi:spoIIIJ-associated protein
MDGLQRISGYVELLKKYANLRLEAVITQSRNEGGSYSHGPELRVEFTGPDIRVLTDRNGELLHAIEHIAAKILRLEPDQHDRISFDADNFKVQRNRDLELSAQAAISQVRASGLPYSFPPMSSRERRLLHLMIGSSGLHSASKGEGPRRSVVLYPSETVPPEKQAPRIGTA